MDLKDYVATIPNFPKEGILFRDITCDAKWKSFKKACDEMVAFAKLLLQCCWSARGFIFGCPVAYVRNWLAVKAGKLPRETISVSYDLEYGSNIYHT